VTSQRMLLAAKEERNLELLSIEGIVSGSLVS
jgi:hypothetical protein